MADSTVFDQVCAELEAASVLDRLSARGTLRIALQKMGLDAESIGAHEMRAVLTDSLAAELDTRGVNEAARLCREIADRLGSA